MYRNAHQSEGQEQQPHNRIEHQREQRDRPAEDKQHTPEKKFNHDANSSLLWEYAGGGAKVPGRRLLVVVS
jgi:hypothetical protein